jgi:hypothetical protein
MKFYLLLSFLFILLIGCNSKPEIFLGFKLLSSSSEYKKHYEDLVKSGKITSNSYSMDCDFISYNAIGKTALLVTIIESFSQDNELSRIRLSGIIDENDSTAYLDIRNCIIYTYVEKYGYPSDTLNNQFIAFQMEKDSRYWPQEYGTIYTWHKTGYSIELKISDEIGKTNHLVFKYGCRINITYEVDKSMLYKKEKSVNETKKDI